MDFKVSNMKHSKHLLIMPLLLFCGIATAQTGIGTINPDPSAALDVSSTTQGLLPPRMTEAQRDAIVNPVGGLMIYNMDENCLQVNVGTPQFPDWSCLARVAQPAEIDSFANCADAAIGSFTDGSPSGGTKTLHYTGGNGGQYNITATSTGVPGLTASANGTMNFGEGDINLTITGIPTGSGTASFSVDISGVTCAFDVTVATAGGAGPDPLPASVLLTAGQEHIIASVYDEDYTPYTSPTGPATTGSQAADGTPDTLVDIQGTLTTTGVEIKIPYNVTGAATVLPGFSETVTVTADKTQGGATHDVTLSYATQSITGTGFITATLKAEGSTLNAKKLDINAGIGNDGKGILMAEFTIATDGFGGTGTVQLRCMAGIPDRAFGDGAHNFLYLPITSSTGEVWLNNNLGANYNKVGHPSFNPAQQGTSATDLNAYGSLYQWGRYSDGHELMNWTGSTGTAVNSYTGTLATGDTPGHGNFIRGGIPPHYDWRAPKNDNLWQEATGNVNNPCPQGFRVPTYDEFTTEFTALGISDAATAYASQHKYVKPGFRYQNNLGDVSQGSQTCYLWTSSTTDSESRNIYIYDQNVSEFLVGRRRGNGMSVRCIKD